MRVIEHGPLGDTLFDLRDDAPLAVHTARRCLGEAREIVRRNGNRTWLRRVACVTDDLTAAMPLIWPRERERLWTRGVDSDGVTWQHAGAQVVWIRPDQVPGEYLETFVHELAHALTRTAHGYTWRRTYVLLRSLLPEAGLLDLPVDVDQIAQHTVFRYRQHCTRWHRARSFGAASTEEVDAHVAAVARSRRRRA